MSPITNEGHSLFNIKMKRSFYFFIGLLSILMMSCSDKKKEDNHEVFIPDSRTDYSMKRSHEDTIAVMDLANQFLTTLKNKDIEGALDQLYEIDSTDVRPLSVKRREQLRNSLSALPVEEYTIDQITLYSDNDSEVRYTTQMFKDSIGDALPGKTKGSLHPYRIDDKWYLTIQNVKLEPVD